MHEATLRQYADEGVNHLQLLDNYIVSFEIVTIECGKGDLPEFCDSVIAVSPVSMMTVVAVCVVARSSCSH